MTSAGPKGRARALRIGIDGRELEGRPTGVGRYLRSLLRRFGLDPRHRFVVYSTSPVSLPAPPQTVSNRVLSGRPPIYWEQRLLPAAALEDGVDVLLSPAYSCPLLSALPRVTAMHDLSFFARPEEFPFAHGLRRRLMARGSARASRRLLACSDFTRGEIGRHLGAAAAEKTAVVLLGPDDDLPQGPPRAEARAALGLEGDAPYLVTVGTVLGRRNIGALVRAFARLKARHPSARLGIVGENRSFPFEDPAALARTLGCEASVVVTGFVADEEVARHYAAADLAVFLSEYEGFGLPALEAMARGVPTIVADRGSLKELFPPAALAILPEEAPVAEALERLLGDPRARADLAARGRERAKAFSWDRAAQQTLAVLEEAAS